MVCVVLNRNLDVGCLQSKQARFCSRLLLIDQLELSTKGCQLSRLSRTKRTNRILELCDIQKPTDD